MNLGQIRTAVRDILTAGMGINTNINADTFWVDREINFYINNAVKQVYRTVRMAQQDYFERILRTTDGPLLLMGRSFTPSTLQLQPNVGNYTLPPDYVAMKLITDISNDKVRFTGADITTERFRLAMQEQANASIREYFYKVIGLRTLIIRPLPDLARDLEFIYIKGLPSLTEYSTGTITTLNQGATIVTFAGTLATSFMHVGDELMVGTPGSNPIPDPSIDYPTIKSIDSDTQVTLDANWLDANVTTGSNFIVSAVPEIPPVFHDVFVHLGVKLAAMKGPNPHINLAEYHGQEAQIIGRQLIDSIEIRQLSDVETSDAYLEGYID